MVVKDIINRIKEIDEVKEGLDTLASRPTLDSNDVALIDKAYYYLAEYKGVLLNIDIVGIEEEIDTRNES